MAAPVVETTSKGGLSGTSTACTLPTGITAGDILFAVASGGNITNFTATGYTVLAQEQQASTVTSTLLIREATGDANDNLTIAASVSSTGTYVVYRISGGDFSNIELAAAVKGSGSSADPGTETPSGGEDDYLYLTPLTVDRASNITAQPSGYTDFILEKSGSGAGASSAIAAKGTTASTSDDPAAWTHTNENYIAWTVSIPPASGSSYVDATISISPAIALTADPAVVVVGNLALDPQVGLTTDPAVLVDSSITLSPQTTITADPAVVIEAAITLALELGLNADQVELVIDAAASLAVQLGLSSAPAVVVVASGNMAVAVNLSTQEAIILNSSIDLAPQLELTASGVVDDYIDQTISLSPQFALNTDPVVVIEDQISLNPEVILNTGEEIVSYVNATISLVPAITISSTPVVIVDQSLTLSPQFNLTQDPAVLVNAAIILAMVLDLAMSQSISSDAVPGAITFSGSVVDADFEVLEQSDFSSKIADANQNSFS